VRPALVSYFDLGTSFGLGDAVFDRAPASAVPDLGNIGLVNPLGSGLAQDLIVDAPEIITRWREVAAAQVTRPAMETGWTSDSGMSKPDFDQDLRELVLNQPVLECGLTIYAIGMVYLKLVFDDGVGDTYTTGMLKCFEYAAYTPDISHACTPTRANKPPPAGASGIGPAVGRERRRGYSPTRAGMRSPSCFAASPRCCFA
jgi:hypothetical protein